MPEDLDPVVLTTAEAGAQIVASILAMEPEARVAFIALLADELDLSEPSGSAIVTALSELTDPDRLPVAAVDGAARTPIQSSAANFTSGDAFPEGQTTLLPGQLGHETNTGKFKMGVGSTAWADLPYAGGSLSIIKTAAAHASDNTTLEAGQVGIESDTGKEKLGAGAWNSLGYRTEPYVAEVASAAAARDLLATDDRKRLRFTHATPVLTIRTQETIAYGANFNVPVGSSANALTITAAPGVTLNGVVGGSITVGGEADGGAFRLLRLAEDVWLCHTGGLPNIALVVAALEALAGAARLNAAAIDGGGFAPIDKTAAEHVSDDTALLDGQRGRETDTGREKVGPGDWNSLDYAGGVFGNLMTLIGVETADARAALTGLAVLLGFTAEGTVEVTGKQTMAEAAVADVYAGGDAIVTADTLAALNAIAEITPVAGLVTVELAKPETDKEDLPRHFRAVLTGDGFLRMEALPAGLAEAEIDGSVAIRNDHTAPITINLAPTIVITPGVITRSAFDATAARAGWSAGSFADRDIPAGETRIFSFRAWRGRVLWSAEPIAKINAFEFMDQHTRDSLRSLNLPTLAGSEWYSAIIVTVTNLDSATPPAVCDGSLISGDNAPAGIEQIDTVANANHCAGRIEGLIFRGGNFTFDNAVLTGQSRFVAVRRHNYRPVSVASLMFAHTWRPKQFGDTVLQNWAAATIPEGEECHLVVVQFARGSGAVPIVPRDELVDAPTAWRSATASHMRGFYTPLPVTVWDQATTNGIINSEGLGLVIPLIEP